MSYEIIGLLHEKFDTQQISENFRKREFILEHIVFRNEKKIVDYVKFQLTGDRCDLIKEMGVNERLKVFFNIKGRKFERDDYTNYFLNLDVWRIETMGVDGVESEETGSETEKAHYNDYLPF